MPKSINGAMFTKMVTFASRLLDLNREKIDALNVFPVPDGDTGTNMSLTMRSAVKELKSARSNSLAETCDKISSGALRGARGNSGVITSQIFKGICSSLRDEEEITTKAFTKALQSATKVAYSAVSKPKEGTILTVIRMMSEGAQNIKAKDFEEYFTQILEVGESALQMTPELLPVLKKAGVVDSGGTGLLIIFRGMQMAVSGLEIAEGEYEAEVVETPKEDMPTADVLNLGDIEFGYCTEFFIINLKKKTTLADIDRLREKLMTMGDSVIVVGDLSFVKVHVHTNTPGKALTLALELGEINNVKIDNMLEEHREMIKKYEAERKPVGVISVAQGDGLAQIFKELNVDIVIEGGQTMNPSADDIANAVTQVNAETVFVLPNNKNIILAAEQAKDLVEGKKIVVVPTKNVPEGLTAAISFDPDISSDDNLMNMLHAIDSVTEGMVTYAVRSTRVDNLTIKKGDFIGLTSKKILTKAKSVEDATLDLIAKLMDKTHSLVNLYFGDDVSQENAESLQKKVAELYPDCDVELYYGGQAVYYYIISLE
ncbi:MAG: DAK2 domain-containing protein [Christensenellaceae bacterium]